MQKNFSLPWFRNLSSHSRLGLLPWRHQDGRSSLQDSKMAPTFAPWIVELVPVHGTGRPGTFGWSDFNMFEFQPCRKKMHVAQRIKTQS